MDAKADLLVFGNAERQIIDIAHHLAERKPLGALRHLRGTAYLTNDVPEAWVEIDSTHLDSPRATDRFVADDPYAMLSDGTPHSGEAAGDTGPERDVDEAVPVRWVDAAQPRVVKFSRDVSAQQRATSYIRLPSFDAVRDDPTLYAHASRILHVESNPKQRKTAGAATRRS